MRASLLSGLRPWFVAALVGAYGCGENETPPPEKSDYQAPTLAPLTCVPNLDGRIDAAELQATFDVSVSLLVNPAGETRVVDTVGAVQKDGTFVLAWDADFATDQVARIDAAPLTDQWFAGSFPNGKFVTPQDLAGTRLGVYQQTDDAFLLWGLVSAEENPPEGKTLIVYETPITLYQFPITVGQTYVSKAVASQSTVQGLPYASNDTYETTVDGMGEVRLPELTFKQALRVRTKVTLQPVAGPSVITRQVSFLSECYGEIARAAAASVPVSQDDGVDIFTQAAEVRRLGF